METGAPAHPGRPDAAHGHEQHLHSGEGPLSMTSTVGVLAVLTVIGGFLQFAGVWTPVTNWLDPVSFAPTKDFCWPSSGASLSAISAGPMVVEVDAINGSPTTSLASTLSANGVPLRSRMVPLSAGTVTLCTYCA